MLSLSTSATAQLITENFLILIVDDIGVDQIGVYGKGKNPPPTPTIDRLAARGVLFRNAWVYPLCSPTRAALLTGRYGFRTGIGKITSRLRPKNRKDFSKDQKYLFGLNPSEITIPRMLGSGYQSAAIGKWHLAETDFGKINFRHPLQSGFGHFSGTIQNISSYYEWEKIVDGKKLPDPVKTYATRATVDDALERIAEMREPWFTYVAFHAAHTPIEPPPEELHTQKLEEVPAEKREFVTFRAVVESLDSEIERLLDGIPEDVLGRTTIFLLGDNGTSSDSVDDPLLVGRGKTTTYESGINIPFIVAGARVGTHARGTESSALVHAVDLFATVAEIAGVEPPPTDSVSFLPLLSEPSGLSVRSFNYSEFFRPNGPPPYRLHAQVVRESRYKLHRRYCVDIELYDLAKDPDERDNLLNGRELAEPERSALDRLHAELDAMVECRSDRDGDGVLDIVDNCRKAKNSDQLDSDKDGTGDACDSR